MTVFLIGYMASGKTTFGHALARRAGMQHVDLDFFIEQRFHTTISNLFASRGEEEFRRIESAMLREVGELENVIISCGGGTPCFCGNMEYMNTHGLTVCLKASEEVTADRILRATGKRPLMAGKTRDQIIETMREHISKRAMFYNQAQLSISGNRLENKSQISETVENFFKNHIENLEQ